jgi:hypothetical protein
MRLLKKSAILAHRYLGIAFGLLVVMWFATGIVMMYAGGMPTLSPERRLAAMPDLDLSRVALTPSEAAARAYDVTGDPGSRVQLRSVMDRPAYRVDGTTVFADTGEVMDEATRAQSRTIASRFMDLPEERIAYLATLTRIDQWTLGQSRAMPLHKFRVNDAAATELYVRPATGEVVTMTTRRSRALAWAGVIPHWFYITALRENQPLWYRLVVWTSGTVCVLAGLGLVLAFTQWRRTRPFRLAKAIPYVGWMRWHYITGVVFGVFTLTWGFSGLLSMEPFAWTNATGLEVDRDALTGGPADLSRFPRMEASAWTTLAGGRAIKEVEFARMQDAHYFVVRLAPETEEEAKRRERLHQPYYITGRAERDRLLVDAGTLAVREEPFSADSLVARLKAAHPDVAIAESDLLSDYDSYYYSRSRQTPLPVLRVKFTDPAATWVYIDPEMSQVLASIHRLNRVERWLYNGLHSLDFAFWYNRRPLWDIGMLALLVGGLTSSGLGLMMGVRRLRRGATRAAGALADVPPSPQPNLNNS